VPVQTLLCLKQNHGHKINSHRWLFTAFGRILNPELCVVLDVGTALQPRALSALWEAFYNDKNLGGACGLVNPDLSRFWRKLVNPIVAAQYFEYKVSYNLDKAMESFFGYLTVLPGAFSAYRYRAIMGRPLEKYFHGDHTLSKSLGKKGVEGMNMFKKNLYLAEDRILSFELATKAGSKWKSKLIRAAKASTDVPETMVHFMSQRRRWLNGGLSSSLYSLMYFHRIFGSGHSIFQKVLLFIQALYNLVNFVLTWFNLSTFLLSIFVVTDLAGMPPDQSNIRAWPFGDRVTPVFNAVLQVLYVTMLVWQVLLALGNRPKGERLSYLASFVAFGFVQLYFIMNVLYLAQAIIKNKRTAPNASSYNYITHFYTDVGELTVWITCGAVFGVYYAVAFLNLDPWYMFLAYPQYLFVVSVYTNIINIYAYCNYNDVTWGSKSPARAKDVLPSASGQQTVFEEIDIVTVDLHFEGVAKRALAPFVVRKDDTERSLQESYAAFRTKLVAAYLFSNFLLCIIVMNDSFDKLRFLVSAEVVKLDARFG
jgi:chitin synthase